MPEVHVKAGGRQSNLYRGMVNPTRKMIDPVFLKERGVNIEQVTSNPKYYQELLMEYSKQHISTEIYKETRERMEVEFNRLCDFRRKNEDELVKKFFEITNERVMNNPRNRKYQK